jgi:hypothetical protein
VAEDLSQACRSILDFHLGSGEPDFDGPEICLHGADNDGDGCFFSEQCFDDSEPVATGVSLVGVVSSTREVFCSFDDLGELYCSCALRSEAGPAPYWDTFSVSLGPAARPATCDFSFCTHETRAEPTGPGECHAQLDTAKNYVDWCSDSFGCSQPATLDGRAVTIQSRLDVLCARAPDQSFYCACGTGDETATYPVGAVQDSSDACAMARTGCLAHVSLPVGPASNVPPALPNPVPDM